jgi:two-component system cell cycle sensor histidine kinase/response regulator CckA
MLRRGGYTYFEARTGREALDLFELHRAEIQLALLDVVMPELSGPETAMRLHATAPALKILFMSGYPRDLFEANEEARELGPLIQKPMSEGALLTAVRRLLDTPPGTDARQSDAQTDAIR